jgi:hypothetical protein
VGELVPPNTSLHRTPAAAPPSPVSSKPLGDLKRQADWLLQFLIGCILAGVGCVSSTNVSAANASRVQAWAEVNVKTVTPELGSVLGPTSEINATVEYTISNFESLPNHYYLAILFMKPIGGTFDPYERFSEHTFVTTPHGVVHLRYALSGIWNDPRLFKPVKVWIVLFERNKPHSSFDIGKVGPLEYGGN